MVKRRRVMANPYEGLRSGLQHSLYSGSGPLLLEETRERHRHIRIRHTRYRQERDWLGSASGSNPTILRMPKIAARARVYPQNRRVTAGSEGTDTTRASAAHLR